MPQLQRPMALVSRPSFLVRSLRMIALGVLASAVFIFGLAVFVVATTK